MRILVTGSTGFIGTHLVDLLLGAGHQVIGLDIRVPSAPSPGLGFRRCDITEKEQLTDVVCEAAPDAVIHLAAQTEPLNETKPGSYAANTIGVENLVEAIRLAKIVRRTIFTSTQLVCRIGYIPKSDTDYVPNTLYGESKIRTEQIVREHEGGGTEWCIVRPTTIWGPGMKPHYQAVFKMIQRRRYFHVGQGPLYKSYGYVRNTVYQYSQLMSAPVAEIQKKVFYLADYEPLSLRAWTNAFQRELMASPIPTCPKPIARVAASVGDVINLFGVKDFPFNSFRLNNVLTEYMFDMSATEAVCGPLPFTFEQGVRETVEWFKNLQKSD